MLEGSEAPTVRKDGTGAGPSSVYVYFERGLRREQAVRLSHQGPVCGSEPRLAVQFSLEVEADHVRRVGFSAATCVTLVAYSELLAELVTGRPVPEARRLTGADLIAALPGVHLLKQDRAHLVARAFRAALETSP